MAQIGNPLDSTQYAYMACIKLMCLIIIQCYVPTNSEYCALLFLLGAWESPTPSLRISRLPPEHAPGTINYWLVLIV